MPLQSLLNLNLVFVEKFEKFEGKKEFLGECKNLLHQKRLDQPNWTWDFIDYYIMSCKNAMKPDNEKGLLKFYSINYNVRI